jgi:hypothetical protein
MHPFNLIQFWSPYFFEAGAFSKTDPMWFHEFGIYSGAILLLALIWVWMRREALPERRALITSVTVFAGASLILALGRYGGIAWLLSHLPVLQSLRAPVRYIVLVQFALAILAAVTMDDLLAIAEGRAVAPAGRMVTLWIPAALGIATTLALNTGVLPFGRHTFANATTALPGVAIVAVVTLLLYLAGRRVRWAIAALIVVTTVDLGVWGIRFIYRERARTIPELTQRVVPPPDEIADSYASAPAQGRYRSDVLVLRGYRLTTGYVGLFPATRHPLDGNTALRLSGTRWTISTAGHRLPAEGGVARVRLLDEQEHDSTGRAWLVVDRPGYLVAHADAPGRRILAFTERFHDGWSASVDDTPLQTVRVNGDFLGCVLEGGFQRVTLRFMPRSFVYGSILSAVGAALLAVVVVARWR